MALRQVWKVVGGLGVMFTASQFANHLISSTSMNPIKNSLSPSIAPIPTTSSRSVTDFSNTFVIVNTAMTPQSHVDQPGYPGILGTNTASTTSNEGMKPEIQQIPGHNTLVDTLSGGNMPIYPRLNRQQDHHFKVFKGFITTCMLLAMGLLFQPKATLEGSLTPKVPEPTSSTPDLSKILLGKDQLVVSLQEELAIQKAHVRSQKTEINSKDEKAHAATASNGKLMSQLQVLQDSSKESTKQQKADKKVYDDAVEELKAQLDTKDNVAEQVKSAAAARDTEQYRQIQQLSSQLSTALTQTQYLQNQLDSIPQTKTVIITEVANEYQPVLDSLKDRLDRERTLAIQKKNAVINGLEARLDEKDAEVGSLKIQLDKALQLEEQIGDLQNDFDNERQVARAKTEGLNDQIKKQELCQKKAEEHLVAEKERVGKAIANENDLRRHIAMLEEEAANFEDKLFRATWNPEAGQQTLIEDLRKRAHDSEEALKEAAADEELRVQSRVRNETQQMHQDFEGKFKTEKAKVEQRCQHDFQLRLAQEQQNFNQAKQDIQENQKAWYAEERSKLENSYHIDVQNGVKLELQTPHRKAEIDQEVNRRVEIEKQKLKHDTENATRGQSAQEVDNLKAAHATALSKQDDELKNERQKVENLHTQLTNAKDAHAELRNQLDAANSEAKEGKATAQKNEELVKVKDAELALADQSKDDSEVAQMARQMERDNDLLNELACFDFCRQEHKAGDRYEYEDPRFLIEKLQEMNDTLGMLQSTIQGEAKVSREKLKQILTNCVVEEALFDDLIDPEDRKVLYRQLKESYHSLTRFRQVLEQKGRIKDKLLAVLIGPRFTDEEEEAMKEEAARVIREEEEAMKEEVARVSGEGSSVGSNISQRPIFDFPDRKYIEPQSRRTGGKRPALRLISTHQATTTPQDNNSPLHLPNQPGPQPSQGKDEMVIDPAILDTPPLSQQSTTAVLPAQSQSSRPTTFNEAAWTSSNFQFEPEFPSGVATAGSDNAKTKTTLTREVNPNPTTFPIARSNMFDGFQFEITAPPPSQNQPAPVLEPSEQTPVPTEHQPAAQSDLTEQAQMFNQVPEVNHQPMQQGQGEILRGFQALQKWNNQRPNASQGQGQLQSPAAEPETLDFPSATSANSNNIPNAWDSFTFQRDDGEYDPHNPSGDPSYVPIDREDAQSETPSEWERNFEVFMREQGFGAGVQDLDLSVEPLYDDFDHEGNPREPANRVSWEDVDLGPADNFTINLDRDPDPFAGIPPAPAVDSPFNPAPRPIYKPQSYAPSAPYTQSSVAQNALPQIAVTPAPAPAQNSVSQAPPYTSAPLYNPPRPSQAAAPSSSNPAAPWVGLVRDPAADLSAAPWVPLPRPAVPGPSTPPSQIPLIGLGDGDFSGSEDEELEGQSGVDSRGRPKLIPRSRQVQK